MTKKEFEHYVETEGFDNAMEWANNAYDFITTYDALKQFAIEKLEEDNVGFALHILNAIYNSEGDSEWFYYDYSMGTLQTPKCINNAEDLDALSVFDEE